jgi:SAM-dependent methyltransferase
MQVKARAVLAGAASFLPILRSRVCRGTGGTGSARYCYSVWLRHAVHAHRCGLNPLVRTLAEVGPGDSLGIGLAALLSGADRYVALDAKAHAAARSNVAVFDDLVRLFRERAPVPSDQEFPGLQPKLDRYDFPHHILSEEVLGGALSPRRVALIRAALEAGSRPHDGIRVDYFAPWSECDKLAPGSVDLVISQAVLEHVDDVAGTCRALHRLLKPGGFMSHNIDFRSHGLTRDWHGHWTLTDATWALVRGSRPYLINRLPHSAHLEAMVAAGFRIAADLRREAAAARRQDLARRFQRLSDRDLMTSGALILAIKPVHPAGGLR